MTPDRTVAADHHAVTVCADWSVVTPHALDAERIAIALGGYSSCVRLADAALPALRRWIALAQRTRAVDVRYLAGTGQWRVGEPAACCRGRGFACAGEAASHARGVPHVAEVFGAEKDTLGELVTAASRAWGVAPTTEPDPVAVRQAMAACLAGQRDVKYLWDVGLSAAAIVRIHGAVGTRQPLPRRFYLGVLTRRVDLSWVARTLAAVPASQSTARARSRSTADRLRMAGHLSDRRAAGGAPEPLTSWLAWTVATWDRDDPTARGRWLALGVPRDLVLMLGDAGIDPGEFAAYAERMKQDAATLARQLCASG